MKKLFVTLVLSCMICSAFSQKTFNQIHFKSYNTYQSSLDFNGDIQGPVNYLKGTIDINSKDSVININPQGQNPLTYKIITIGEEWTNSSDERFLSIQCKDAEGKNCDAKIKRTKNKSYMEFIVSYGRQSVFYTCDYLNKL